MKKRRKSGATIMQFMLNSLFLKGFVIIFIIGVINHPLPFYLIVFPFLFLVFIFVVSLFADFIAYNVWKYAHDKGEKFEEQEVGFPF